MRDRSWRDVGAALVTAFAALAAQWGAHVTAPGAPFAPYAVAEWAIVHAPGTVAPSILSDRGRVDWRRRPLWRAPWQVVWPLPALGRVLSHSPLSPPR